MSIYFRRTIGICTPVPSNPDTCRSRWTNLNTGKKCDTFLALLRTELINKDINTNKCRINFNFYISTRASQKFSSRESKKKKKNLFINSPSYSIFLLLSLSRLILLCVSRRLPYADLFGGVSAMSREHFQLVNGFSNVFWGWGGEDDDMANRIKAHGLHISRYPANVARYKMLTHKKEKANPKRSVSIRFCGTINSLYNASCNDK